MSDLQKLLEVLDELGPTLQKAGEQPPAETKLASVDGITKPEQKDVVPSLGFLSLSDQLYVRKRLMQLSTPDLERLFTHQLIAGIGNGVPVEKAINPSYFQSAVERSELLTKELDTAGGAALIRQDLDPILQVLFIRAFPAWERIPKVPANGAVHAWNQITDPGTSAFMAELGTVTDDKGTYVRKTTNIAVLATRRGVTFKEQLAVPAGGMNWDAARLEIQNGLTAMAAKLQKTIFQGQADDSGGTASNELGAYDANGFTGLRAHLNTVRAVNFSPYLTTNPDNFVKAFNDAIVQITDTVGVPPTVIYARAGEASQFMNQQLAIQRTVDRTEFVPGVRVPAVATAVGELPIVPVPGPSIGTYTAATFSNKTVADLYILNEPTVVVPYLGGPNPQVLEIPPGVSGQLTRLWILWFMGGLAVLNLPANNKLRANLATT
jgi:hypothetical protein